MQDLVTERKYRLPILNVITSNDTTNYIKNQQADLKMNYFGIQLTGQNFAMIANGMGIQAVNVNHFADLAPAFNLVRRVTRNGRPFVINVQITSQRGLPTEALRISTVSKHWVETTKSDVNLRKFFDRYGGATLHSLPFFLNHLRS